MIDLYTWSTPNGRKVSVLLEELGLPYRVHAVDITQNEQFAPAFVALSPNSKIPAIVDEDGPDGVPFSLFESGAILLYLAEKHRRFLPAQARPRYETIQWLMFQMGGVGPMFGQAHHFLRFAREKVPYAMQRYGNEARRLYGVLDRRLAEHEFLAGEYTIADMATFPWVARHAWHEVALGDFRHVQRWFDVIGARAPVQRGMQVPA
ncbi:MAG: glutathione S-transferase N-terminal domain-containing protein [Burkholderiales bacterium]